MKSVSTKIFSAHFLITAVSPEHYPPSQHPEVAFVGRSNVGKSSLMNALCQRHKLVRVSKEPGRTRALNFFDVVASVGNDEKHTVRFCDLPGYGFAKVGKAERQQWKEMIETYLTTRQLCCVVCLVDSQVGATNDDFEVANWLLQTGHQLIVAATKMDRLPKHQRIPCLHHLEGALGVTPAQTVGVSATKHLGLDLLWNKIFQYFRN